MITIRKIVLVIVLVFLPLNVQADIFSDAWNGVKSAANKVADVAKDAANAVADAAKKAADFVADRFKDTQATRAIDFGVRYAALQAAHKVAIGALEVAKTAASSTLIASRETAKASLVVAEEFLNKVVQNVTKGVLKGSAEAAKGTLEGIKQGTTGVIEAGRWVITSTLGAVDVNELYYRGKLSDLKDGELGNVRLKGKVIAPFSIDVNLDTKNIWGSLNNIVMRLLNEFKNVIKGKTTQVTQQLAPASQTAADFATIDSKVAQVQQNEQSAKAESARVQKELIEAQKQIANQVSDTRKKLADLAVTKIENIIEQIDNPAIPDAQYLLALKILSDRQEEYEAWRDQEEERIKKEAALTEQRLKKEKETFAQQEQVAKIQAQLQEKIAAEKGKQAQAIKK